MKAANSSPTTKRRSLVGILGGALVLLSCELPIVLSFFGLGALTAVAEVVKPPYWLEIFGITALLAGCLSLGWYVINPRKYRNSR